MPLWYDDAAAGRSLRAAPLGAQLSGSLFVPEGGFWHDKLWFLVQQVCWARIASVAQLVEQLSCKQQVTGSSPAGGSTTTYISETPLARSNRLCDVAAWKQTSLIDHLTETR